MFKRKQAADAMVLEKAALLDRIFETRRTNIVSINLPLVLISQIQRSGGTLLSQLFDGHPELHTHPHELHIGRPNKWDWPQLDLRQEPSTWLEALRELPLEQCFYEGYRKYPSDVTDARDTFPFLLSPQLLREIFLTQAGGCSVQREILDAYFTAFFNAWLDYGNLYGRKAFIAAFCPRLSMHADSMERYLQDYPDGRLIMLIREPYSWCASALRHNPHEYPDAESAMRLWRESLHSAARNKAILSERAFVASYEELIRDPETLMRRIAAWLGIAWQDSLAVPTFQQMPIKANAHDAVASYGIIDAPAKRGEQLTQSTRKTVAEFSDGWEMLFQDIRS